LSRHGHGSFTNPSFLIVDPKHQAILVGIFISWISIKNREDNGFPFSMPSTARAMPSHRQVQSIGTRNGVKLGRFGIVSALCLIITPSAAFTTTSSFPVIWRVEPNLLQGRNPISRFHFRTPDYATRPRRRGPLTTTSADENDKKSGPLDKAVAKFKARPGTYLLIPCVAAIVGWFTNWLAVQMIFYPVRFRGIPIYRRPEIPLGFLGWQGIVPCKTRPMSEAMVEMVTSQLLTVEEVFARLDPKKVASLLAPEVPKLTNSILQDLFPKWVTAMPSAVFQGLDSVSQGVMMHFNRKFLEGLTKNMQSNIDSIFSLRNCVVDQMLRDRSKLGELFKICGQKELDFLTNSGLWFGFLLGLIQMAVALFWDNPWSLSIGGGIVGLATNWLALKWIFEPVDPTRIGPFVLQGQFLRRQPEVAREFSAFFANQILTAEQLWYSVLNDPATKPAFATMFASHFTNFVHKITHGFGVTLEPETMKLAAAKALEKLPNHVPVLFPYMDKALQLESTLRVKMEQMTSRQFERGTPGE
jgi:uncharacterized membrane protein YheB (UPF0754 family)